MKPSSTDSTSKGALSKTLKKTTKPRSKILKVNTSQAAATPQIIPQEPSTSASQECVAEKPFNRCYAGFGPKTIQIMWEQYDTSDTEIESEVYPKLAEDVSYKVWEAINNIKTYTRHSGTTVTADIVNEVFKDADVPPVLGSTDVDWERVDYDESIFFDADGEKTIDLREEYLRPIHIKRPIEVEFTRSWVIDRRFTKVVLEFTGSIGRCIFLGNYEAFEFGIETAAFSPYIGCCLKLLLRKCIEMLAFDQKYYTIERTYKFLQALAVNPYSRDVDCNIQLFHLAEIFICNLLGTYDSIETTANKNVKLENNDITESPILKQEIKEEVYSAEDCTAIENDPDKYPKETKTLNQTDVDDIRTEYEELFNLMERDGFKERAEVKSSSSAVETHLSDSNGAGADCVKEEIIDSVKQEDDGNNNTDSHDEEDTMNKQEQKCTTGNKTIPNYAMKMEVEENNEPVEAITVNSESDSEPDPDPTKQLNLNYSPATANQIDFENVDVLCETVGIMSTQFGYFQTECTYLINQRVEKFFNTRDQLNEMDYQFISRSVRCLIALGESAFRDFLPHLDKIDTDDAPPWIYNDFALAAVFLRGSGDIFLYEWLEDLCGNDKLQPFMINSYRYHQKLITKKYQTAKKPSYKIYPKVTIEIRPKHTTSKKLKVNINEVFPNRIQPNTSPKQIGFKFAGCQQIPNKTKSTSLIIKQKSLNLFNTNVVIGRRKLYKPLVNRKLSIKLCNYCFTQI